MRRFFKCHIHLLLLLLLNSTSVLAQNTGLQRLYASISAPIDSTFPKKTYREMLINLNGEIDYISSLKFQLANKSFYNTQGRLRDYYYDTGIAATFIGDSRSAIAFFDSSENVGRTQKIKLSEGSIKRYDSLALGNIDQLYASIDTSKIVMLNESHHKSLNRVFAYTLLDYLYKKGFRYLAAEALRNPNNQYIHRANFIPFPSLGYYVLDPMLSEFFRYATQLGFTLVPYEFVGDMIDREAMQAHTISNVLLRNPNSKVFVYAGYGHIEKTFDELKPMGYFLKLFTGIEPLSINQQQYTEGNTNSIAQLGYHYLVQRHNIKKTAILLKNGQPFYRNKPKTYDFYLIHPPTINDKARPDWIQAFGISKEKVVVSTLKENCFLVQAYYQKEEKKTKNIHLLIPADQTYDGFPTYTLYLPKGKFIIVQRDIQNNIIHQENLTVK